MTQWAPHVTVATVIERSGKFLMVEEAINGELVINQPAGHLEPNETLIEAAIRETLEETAWEISIEGILGVSLYRAPQNAETYYRTTFIGKALRQTNQPLDTGIERAIWMSRDELLANAHRLRSPMVMKSIDLYLIGKRYPLDVIYST